MQLVQLKSIVVSRVSSTVATEKLLKKRVCSLSTYRDLMSFYHVIKLLINLFVFLLSAGGEDQSGLELRALPTLVLLLVQCLARSHDQRKWSWGKHEDMKVRIYDEDTETK